MVKDREDSVKPDRRIKAVDRLLGAAQHILAESGLEALNSNAIVERAGLTPPTFYHYFPNKHALLRELGLRLMDAQTEAIRADTGMTIRTAGEMRSAALTSIRQSLDSAIAFRGAYPLLVALRAVPELQSIRLESHERITRLLADYFAEQGLVTDYDDVLIRVRLSLEISYAAVEMLFETGFRNREAILEYTADAVTRIYDFF
ncbi:TetR/AcrR family transcriptional regulator [Maricaulis sp.]|uniref:TetR/AcrR family transcriptional regulator n=1 Tax=Maricaulis sp. TaxID=1486257 RepID=UPI0032974FCC